MGIFAQLLNNTEVGAPAVAGNLAMFPLHNQDARPVDYAGFPQPGQLGAVFAVNGAVVGFDLFDSADHCARYFRKLLNSHALDAAETAGRECAPPEREAVKAFLESFDDSEEELHPAIGIGEDIRVETEAAVGAGLRWKDRYVHLAGFAKNGA